MALSRTTFFLRSSILLSGFLIVATALDGQGPVTSPEDFFGFRMGSDKKLARWDRMVEYFYLLEEQSDRMKVFDMGPSSEGHPFLVLLITSPENLSRLDELQDFNRKINDPRGHNGDEIERAIREGKAVVMQSMSLHASEVGGTQMAPELCYDLLARQDKDTKRILGQVLFFMIPCFNPDGQVMITDWYRETVGTPYEGLGMPWLYHKYCGHDNNRDGDYHNLPESKYTARIMFVDWIPQAYMDHHHMGSYGARFYVPPYCDPIRPYADPLVWREISWYGAHIAYRLEEEGFQGVLNAAQFAGWGHFGWHWITPFHNIAGMLTESATTNLASPVYIHPEQLRAGARMFPEYEAQSTFPNPWPGGWWHLRTIVEQQKSAAWSLLDMAARNRETILRAACMKARNQIRRGKEGDVRAIVIPAEQHDYLTAVRMVNTLLRSGIEIQKARHEFYVEDMHYPTGSWVIPLAQPKMGLIRNLLTETRYVDNAWTRRENGEPIEPYDLATHTMFEFMGVRADAVGTAVEGGLTILNGPERVVGKVAGVALPDAGGGYIMDGRQNAAYKAANILINNELILYRTAQSGPGYRTGDFILREAPPDVLAEVAAETGVDFMALKEWPEAGLQRVSRGRTGLFQRYYGGNMDEGWTRLCLENFSFPYATLMSEEIRQGNLNKKYDVIIVPNDRPEAITGIFPEDSRFDPGEYPEKYRSGIGREGIRNLKEFVERGGTLVTFGQAYEFAVDEFDLDVREVTGGLSSWEFFCPGSTLRVDIDNTHPLAYGMPGEGLVLFWSGPVFEIIPSRHNEAYETVVRYPSENLLKSGWLDGEEKIANKPAMITTDYGKGRIVLIGFRTQHRNQTDGTFKFLFNCIIASWPA
jgi:hypothetical protein